MNLQHEGPQQAQTDWLTNDLAANTAACTIAYFHHPVLSIGARGDEPNLYSTWAQLVDAGVDIVLTAHDHNYQRWVPMDRDLVADPSGATQFVLGGGGHGIRDFVRTDTPVAAASDSNPGALGSLKLELNSDGAAFSYVNTAGAVLDAGAIECTPETPDVTAPTVPGGVGTTATGHTDVGIN